MAQATADNPVGICGPIGPTEQLPLVARIVNALGLSLTHAHFWGMDEWVERLAGKWIRPHPLSFERADRELCFNRIRPRPADATGKPALPQGRRQRLPRELGRGRALRGDAGRAGRRQALGVQRSAATRGPIHGSPPPVAEYRTLATRVVDLHPLTIAQNARTSGGGNITLVPTQAITVGPVETWKAEKVSIWHAGKHDNPFGQRLTALMISSRVMDTAVPMSLLADHPNVQFNSTAAASARARWRCTDSAASRAFLAVAQ